MKFKNKYPNIKPLLAGYKERYKSEETEVEPGILYSGRHYECAVCHDITPFIEMNFEAHFCSEECVIKYEKIYSEALLNIPEGRERDPIFIPNDQTSPSNKSS